MHDEQELLAQPAHPEVVPPAIICEPLCAKNTETALRVWLPWHALQVIGESASLIERIISNRLPQSLQIYSYIGISTPECLVI